MESSQVDYKEEEKKPKQNCIDYCRKERAESKMEMKNALMLTTFTGILTFLVYYLDFLKSIIPYNIHLGIIIVGCLCTLVFMYAFVRWFMLFVFYDKMIFVASTVFEQLDEMMEPYKK